MTGLRASDSPRECTGCRSTPCVCVELEAPGCLKCRGLGFASCRCSLKAKQAQKDNSRSLDKDDFEPGFEDALKSLRKLSRKANRHNDFDGPMRLSSGQVLVLVDCALSLMDRFDREKALTQIRENFRYE